MTLYKYTRILVFGYGQNRPILKIQNELNKINLQISILPTLTDESDNRDR